LSGLLDEVASLRARVNELESDKGAPKAPTPSSVADEAESGRLA
jgi:hypothetical protein